MIRTTAKFAVFTAVCLSFTTYLAFAIGNISLGDPLARDYYTLQAEFSDVSGLLVADNVKVAGVVVGKVTKIKIEDGHAVVSFKVGKQYSLPSDTSAGVRWRNLIGQRYVYLYPGTNTTTTLAAGETIPLQRTTPVVDLGKLFNELGPIVSSLDSQDINTFLDTIGQALDGNQDKIGQALDDLAVLTTSLAGRDDEIGRLIENVNTVAGTIAARDEQIRVMLDNLVLLSTTLSANTETLDIALQEFGRFSTNLNTLVEDNTSQIDRLIANLATLVNETVSPNLGNLDTVLANLGNAATRIFAAGSYGEWLNQKINCVGLGPPGSLPLAGLSANNCAGLGTLPLPLPGVGTGGTLVAGDAPAGATAAGPAVGTTGSGAGSFTQGVDALLGLLGGALSGGTR